MALIHSFIHSFIQEVFVKHQVRRTNWKEFFGVTRMF